LVAKHSQTNLKAALELGEYHLVQEMNHQPANTEWPCLSTTKIIFLLPCCTLLM